MEVESAYHSVQSTARVGGRQLGFDNGKLSEVISCLASGVIEGISLSAVHENASQSLKNCGILL
jgi:hypothetical protein